MKPIIEISGAIKEFYESLPNEKLHLAIKWIDDNAAHDELFIRLRQVAVRELEGR